MAKIIFCGDRNWIDRGWIIQVMSTLKENLKKFVVIEGEAKGVDAMSRSVALDICELPVKRFPAKWGQHKLAAGPIRNRQMLDEGKADAVVAFHLNLDESKGTADMVREARNRGLPVWVCTDGPDALAEFIIRVRRLVKDGVNAQ